MKTSLRNRHRLHNRRRARCHVINPYQYERRTMPPSHASRAFPSQQCFKMKKMEMRMLEALKEGGSRLYMELDGVS